jgi:hypothetical protein
MVALVLLLMLSCQRHFKAYVVSPTDGNWNWWSSISEDDACSFVDAGIRVIPEWSQEYKDTAAAKRLMILHWLDSLGADTSGLTVLDDGYLVEREIPLRSPDSGHIHRPSFKRAILKWRDWLW